MCSSRLDFYGIGTSGVGEGSGFSGVVLSYSTSVSRFPAKFKLLYTHGWVSKQLSKHSRHLVW